MGKRILMMLTAVLMLAVGMTAAKADPQETAVPGDGEVIIGYFRKNRAIKPHPEASREQLGSVNAYTIMEMKAAGENWGLYTSPEGITGYIYCEDLLPVPEAEPCGERIVYCRERQALRSLPEGGQQDPRRVEAMEMLTVNGTYGDYTHVRTPEGEEGYILTRVLQEADFTPEAISPVRFCPGQESGAAALPLKGAEEIMTVYPGTVYEASEGQGEYYVLRTEEGAPAYVWKGDVRLLQTLNPTAADFFRASHVAGRRGDGAAENIYTRGRVRTDSVMYTGDGSRQELKAGEGVYVYASYGGFCGVSRHRELGYVPARDLELQTPETVAAAIAGADLKSARVEKNPFLDQAFSLLEEGNPFLRRYNAATGSDIQPLFSRGVPYFWGGRGYNILTERWPEYTIRECWQSSINYYRKGNDYIYGFDCIGLVKNVYRMAGHDIQGTVEDLGLEEVCASGRHIFCSGSNPLPEDWRQAAEALEAGDLLWVKHPGVHAMIYIGTLRDYGYTEKELPEMAAWLDYPLMIHCGRNPYAYFRFRELLESPGSERLASAMPPDGGVSICLLGPEKEEAEILIEYLERTDGCFDVEGSCVTVFPFSSVTSYFFYRDTPGEEDK